MSYRLDSPSSKIRKAPSTSLGDSASLSDVLHKRRGGFGKLADNNWVPRCFTLHSSILCYYDCESFADVDPSRPRGRIDLCREDTLASGEDVQKPGAPSKYIVVLQIFILGGIERKWKMCCSNKLQQKTWVEALKHFDGPPDMNLGDSIIDLIGLSSSQEKKRPPFLSQVSKIQTSVIKSFTPVDDPSSPSTPYLLIMSANFLLAATRVAPIDGFWVSLILVNVIMAKLLHIRLPSKLFVSEMAAEEEEDDEELEVGRKLKPGNTMPLCTANLESELFKTLKETPMETKVGLRAACGNFVDWQKVPHSYRPGDATIFKVRHGPNYKKTGLKSPSKKSLFELYAVDLVQTPDRLKESSIIFEPPVVLGVTDIDTGSAYIPPMIIVSCGMPSEEPSLFGNEPDGPSFMAIFYFVIGEECLKELKAGIETASPAVKLLEEWCRRGESEPAFRGRFKAMCILDDIEKLGLPMPIPSYNGKPVLINKSGKFFRREKHIEMSVNVHMFAFLARKMLYTIQPKFPTMCLNVGFVIEGRDDDELPETMLGVGKLTYMEVGKAPAPDDLMKDE